MISTLDGGDIQAIGIGVICESIDCPHGDHVDRAAAATATTNARMTTVLLIRPRGYRP